MSRMSVFNSPLLLGFDRFERALDRVAKSASDGYPPYNVEQVNEDRLRITVAVAGFRPEDLEVRVEDTQLVIRGRQSTSEEERVYLHRGIATRQFQRRFVLSEGMEVSGAHLDNGLLHVDLQRIEPEPAVRTVEIQTRKTSREEVPTLHSETPAEGNEPQSRAGAPGKGSSDKTPGPD